MPQYKIPGSFTLLAMVLSESSVPVKKCTYIWQESIAITYTISNIAVSLSCMYVQNHVWTAIDCVYAKEIVLAVFSKTRMCALHMSWRTPHWGRVTHICVSKLTIIGSDNGLSPGRRQAIIWTNAEILLIGPLGTKFGEILIEIHTFPFKKMHLKMSSGKWRPFCLGLNVIPKVNSAWPVGSS